MFDKTLISIRSGFFSMGSSNRYSWESPRHQVWINAFEISRTAITRAEYGAFLQDTQYTEPAGWNEPQFAGANLPAVGISWFAAVAYCEWKSAVDGRLYRLPTEAEWEKACRGGLDGCEYAWGDQPPGEFEYFSGEWNGPRPVGEWRPNGYGLCNMGDNVHEWCSDWYAPDYYARSPERNPAGPDSGTRRVSRGGSWRHQVKASRAAHRSSLPPSYAYTDYGFRIVAEIRT